MKVFRINYDGRNELLIACSTQKEAQARLCLPDATWRRLKRGKFVVQINERMTDYQAAIERPSQALWAPIVHEYGKDKVWQTYSSLSEVGGVAR